LEEKWKARTRALFESTKAKEAKKDAEASSSARITTVDVYGPPLPTAPLVIVNKNESDVEEVTLSSDDSDEEESSSDSDDSDDGRRHKSRKEKKKSKSSRKDAKKSKKKDKKKRKKKRKHKSGRRSD
jgi:hypothetical protein